MQRLQCTSEPSASHRHITQAWNESRAWLRRHKARLGLFVRVTASALLAFEAASWLNFPVPLWTVLTAIIVTQINVGRSLKATIDYMAGTIGGAMYGGLIGVLLGHHSDGELLLGLGIAVGPLALIAARRPSLTAAPITAVIVLLVPTMTHGAPLVSAVDRVVEVAVGAIIGLTMSFVLLPASAHGLAMSSAARTLERLADAVGELIIGFKTALDVAALQRIQDSIGTALMELHLVGVEAEHERAVRVATAPDVGPLLRTLLRLRHDLVMIGRAAVTPLPESLHARLEPVTDIAAAVQDFLRSSGRALLAQRQPSHLDGVESALNSYAATIVTVRNEGLTRCMPSEVAERFFALCFALEQLRGNLRDLHRCVAEAAQPFGHGCPTRERGDRDEPSVHAPRGLGSCLRRAFHRITSWQSSPAL
jgi:uncharacterized membrane protein YccC